MADFSAVSCHLPPWRLLPGMCLVACQAVVSSDLDTVQCEAEGSIGPPACFAGDYCRDGECTPCREEEECGDGLDDNCNGTPDDGCDGGGAGATGAAAGAAGQAGSPPDTETAGAAGR